MNNSNHPAHSERPDVPPQPPKTCDHKYVHLRTVQTVDSSGYNNHWKQVTYFFCEKCLKEELTLKHEYSRDVPDWWERKK